MRPLAKPPLTLSSAARSHAGAVRTLNEDRVVERPDARLFAVADGMGGHEAGDAASSLVAEALERLPGGGTAYAFLQGVSTALSNANAILRERSREKGVCGATVVVLIIDERHAACLWAGDSRAYRLSGGELERLSHDHSLVQELLDAGAITSDEAAADRRANIVTRAVGATDILLLETAYAPVAAGDRFLLCSDGLTGVLSDDEIASLLAMGDAERTADLLLSAALDRAPSDNVSLVVVEAA